MFDDKREDVRLINAKVVEVINNCTLIITVIINNITKNINCILYNIPRLDLETEEGRFFKNLLEKILPEGKEIKVFMNTERRAKPILDSHLVTVFIDGEVNSLNRFLVEKRKTENILRGNKMATSKKETYIRNAIVKRIISADTMVLDVDLGCNVFVNMTAKLNGITVPDKLTTEYKESKKWLDNELPLETKVVVQLFKNKEEMTTKYTVMIFKDMSLMSVNDTMVVKKLALPFGVIIRPEIEIK